MSLPGPSRTITVQPIEVPARPAPAREPERVPAPEPRKREPVPKRRRTPAKT